MMLNNSVLVSKGTSFCVQNENDITQLNSPFNTHDVSKGLDVEISFSRSYLKHISFPDDTVYFAGSYILTLFGMHCIKVDDLLAVSSL